MTDVCLVQMPYALVNRPSLGLSLLKSYLETAGLSTRILYANILFAEEIGLDVYRAVEESRPHDLLTVQFPAETCRACALRAACTTAPHGRSITLHPEEALLQTLRATAHTPDGRATLRRRTTVEHSLARLDHIQGPKARYKGTRKNTLDVRRCATVDNLQSLARMKPAA